MGYKRTLDSVNLQKRDFYLPFHHITALDMTLAVEEGVNQQTKTNYTSKLKKLPTIIWYGWLSGMGRLQGKCNRLRLRNHNRNRTMITITRLRLPHF